jgi:NAD(P)-dependent dehydrogenase (short-subunit alcohol dehydrogenase family)
VRIRINQGLLAAARVRNTLTDRSATFCRACHAPSQVSEAERLFQEVLRHYGRIDIAVNATGRHFKRPIIETKSIEWEEVSHRLGSLSFTSPVAMAVCVTLPGDHRQRNHT